MQAKLHLESWLMKNSDIASMCIRLNTVQAGFSEAKDNKKGICTTRHLNYTAVLCSCKNTKALTNIAPQYSADYYFYC